MDIYPNGMVGKEKGLPLALKAVEKHFKRGWREKKEALKGVTLSVREGEIFGLLGPNGAGKSTLVKISLGLTLPNAGEALLNGLPPTDPKAREGVGYLPEHFRPPHKVSPARFIRFMGEVGKGSSESYHWREVLAMVGLEQSAWTREMGKLSKGMLQRVGLASTLVHKPRFLILDEPLSGLDPIGRHDVKELLLEFNRQGGTIFLNSHILADIGSLCHRVGILHRGRLLFTGTIEELLRTAGKTSLEEAFLAVVRRSEDD